MKLAEVQSIAERVRAELSPFCERCEIAGNVRRKRPEPKDIEIVCIPKTIPGGLFKDLADREPRFIRTVNQWFGLKGDVAIGRYAQHRLPEGINLDLFMTTPERWGLIYAIRTGSAEYSHQVLAMGWTRLGYKSENGVLWRNGQPTYIREEQDLFDLLGIPYREPERREL